jgi:hypothetical protein
MRWVVSNRADPLARVIADRHYNRQSVGSKQFVPPGSCCVLLEREQKAFWVTSAPMAEYVKHEWAGAWSCSAFRSEDAGESVELVRQALAASRYYLGEPPELGLITFIDPRHVTPVLIRGVPSWGYIWVKAGFHYVGKTKAGLPTFQILPRDMPGPAPALPRTVLQIPMAAA